MRNRAIPDDSANDNGSYGSSMRQTIAWLFDVHGRVSRRDYFRWGVGLMVVKLLIDWATCTLWFPRPWRAEEGRAHRRAHNDREDVEGQRHCAEP